MKINPDKNPELDSCIFFHLRLFNGCLHQQILFENLQLNGNLPSQQINGGSHWVEWCYLDFLKYLAMHFACVPRFYPETKTKPFNKHHLKQLTLKGIGDD